MGLLSFLLGNHNDPNAQAQPPQPAQAPPQSSTGFGYDPQGFLVPQQPPTSPGALVQHYAKATPATPLAQAAVPQAQQPQDPNAPITVQGNQAPDTWQPHKAGILGQIADYLLNTHIGRGVERKNETEAMQNLTSDPMQAIHRMMKVDPRAAEALYEKVVDNQRADGAQNRLNRAFDFNTGKAVDAQVGGMMYTAAKSGNPAAYQAARNRAMEVGGRYGIDYSTLPENPTPEDVQMLAAGQIPAAKQMANDETHSYHKDTTDYRNRNLTERTNFHQGELKLGGARVGVAQENADTAGQNADIHEESVQNTQGRFDDTHQGRTVQAQGRPGHGEVANDGKTMTWFMPDGTKHLYLKGADGSHWVYTHQSKAPKPAK